MILPVYQIHKTIAANQSIDLTDRCFHQYMERLDGKTFDRLHLACSSSVAVLYPFDTKEAKYFKLTFKSSPKISLSYLKDVLHRIF